MNGIETPVTPSNDLPQQIRQLRTLLAVTLALVIILSGSLNLFLWRELSNTRKDADALRPQAAQVWAQFQATRVPAMTNFAAKLLEYSKTHPGLDPILQKYGVKPPPSAATAPKPAAKPTVATPPAKK